MRLAILVPESAGDAEVSKWEGDDAVLVVTDPGAFGSPEGATAEAPTEALLEVPSLAD
jgi:hypothetical protein